MKTKEELNALREEFVTLNKKIAELSPEELQDVTGGITPPSGPEPGWGNYKVGLYCPVCGVRCPNPAEYGKHMREVHNSHDILE